MGLGTHTTCACHPPELACVCHKPHAPCGPVTFGNHMCAHVHLSDSILVYPITGIPAHAPSGFGPGAAILLTQLVPLHPNRRTFPTPAESASANVKKARESYKKHEKPGKHDTTKEHNFLVTDSRKMKMYKLLDKRFKVIVFKVA